MVASEKVLPRGGSLTQSSVREYVKAVRQRYFLASKREKGKILDEFTKVTGRHRKAAIRLIRYSGSTRAGKKRGRPRKYNAAVVEALRLVWEATDPHVLKTAAAIFVRAGQSCP